jgi:hypothetical protein
MKRFYFRYLGIYDDWYYDSLRDKNNIMPISQALSQIKKFYDDKTEIPNNLKIELLDFSHNEISNIGIKNITEFCIDGINQNIIDVSTFTFLNLSYTHIVWGDMGLEMDSIAKLLTTFPNLIIDIHNTRISDKYWIKKFKEEYPNLIRNRKIKNRIIYKEDQSQDETDSETEDDVDDSDYERYKEWKEKVKCKVRYKDYKEYMENKELIEFQQYKEFQNFKRFIEFNE